MAQGQVKRTASPPPGSRSNMRPQSSASNASTNSATTQPNMPVGHMGAEQARMSPQFWQQGHGFDTGVPVGHQGHPGDHAQQPNKDDVFLLQHAASMEASANFQMGGMMGPQIGPHHHMQHQMPPQHQMATQHQMQPQHQAYHPHDWNAAQMANQYANAAANGNARNPSAVKVPAGNSKRRSNANNDGELKDLLQSNLDKPLDEVVKSLRANERGPNAERTRQLYAMLWLKGACVESKNSIPRSRVYHVYASRCSDDRLTVLNPASFGKLVRVVFPAIKTRRLGVRGESKYHYCNFELRDPPPAEVENAPDADVSGAFDFNTAPAQTADDMGAGRLPSPEERPVSTHTPTTTSGNLGCRSHSRYNIPQPQKDEAKDVAASKTPLQLSFATEEDRVPNWAEKVVLPNIEPYLPPNTDPDTAESLVALYRSQCTSIIESFRYVKDKNIFHLYTSFHGTMTMPVQKLFAHESIAPWIEGCDIYLYQRLTKIVFGMSLQAFPRNIFNRFQTLSQRLVDHIRKTFQGQPEHTVRAKVEPAIIFAGILERMTRVNLTAHAAASPLALEANRNLMYEEWQDRINVRKIAECVPTGGMDRTAELLMNQMRLLLQPTQVRGEAGSMELGLDDPNDSCVDRWRKFLMSLPSQFPDTPHVDIMWCVERVSSAISRELTIHGCNSFSTWWSLKAYVDEEVMFLAEVGGFLRCKRIREPVETQESEASAEVVEGGAATEEADGDVEMSQSQQPMPAAPSPGRSDRAPFPPKHSRATDTAVDVHEDSGIGIRTPETDFPVDRFTFDEAQAEMGY